jgi:hypothetical protein
VEALKIPNQKQIKENNSQNLEGMDKMHDINNIKLTPNTPSLQTSWVNNVLEPSYLPTRIKTYVSPSIS